MANNASYFGKENSILLQQLEPTIKEVRTLEEQGSPLFVRAMCVIQDWKTSREVA